MSKTAKIIKHEFTVTVRRVGFAIMTLIVPVLVVVLLGIARLTSVPEARRGLQAERIGVVDEAGGFGQGFQQGAVTLRPFSGEEAARRALLNGEINQYLIIPPDYIATGSVRGFTLSRDIKTPDEVLDAVRHFLTANLLSDRAPQEIIRRVEAPLNLQTITLDENGVPTGHQEGPGKVLIPLVVSLLLLFSILFSSGQLLNSLSEEKENRLMEILVSRVSPFELFAGKVLGIGASGLVQVAVWLLSFLLIGGLASSSLEGFLAMLEVPASIYILGIVYFILGYLFYGVLSAGLGALSTSSREGHQMVSLFVPFLAIPLWFMGLYINFPHSSLWTVLSIFPLTAPTMVMVRLGLSGIGAWELAASILTLAAAAVGGLLFSARIFGSYLLMYGKRPRLGDIIRSLGGKAPRSMTSRI